MKRFLVILFVVGVVFNAFSAMEFGTYLSSGATIIGFDTTNNITLWNPDTSSPYLGFQLKISGAAAPGINYWAFYQNYFNANLLSGSYLKDGSFLGSGGGFNTHVQFWQKWGELVLFLNENWRINMYQPFLRFSDSVGSDNAVGVHGRFWNLFGSGAEFKFTLMDYKNELFESSVSENKNETAFIFRLAKDDFDISGIKIALGTTVGFAWYQRPRQTSNYNEYIEKSWREGQYNVAGVNAGVSGGFGIFSFNIGGEVGRSFAPDQFPVPDEEMTTRFLLGNTNSLVYKISTKLGVNEPKTIGGIELTYIVTGLQPSYRQYLGGVVDPSSGKAFNYFEEFLQFTYALPLKIVNLKSYLKYYHPYKFDPWTDFDGIEHNDYYLIQFLTQRKMLIKSSGHGLDWISELYAEFKGGVKSIIELEQYYGFDYLGFQSFENWIRHIAFKLNFENQFARIIPMIKFFNFDKPEKSFYGFGLESTVNILSWLKFYSRFGFMSGNLSEGIISESGLISWTSFFGQLQIYPANNTRILVEYGDGSDMDNNLIADSGIVKGSETGKRINIFAEMYF